MTVAVLDACFVKAIVDPNHEKGKEARDIFYELVKKCWRFVWHHKRLLKHYRPVLGSHFMAWDKIKNDLETERSGQRKLVVVNESKINERKLTKKENREIAKADIKDILLFEIARGAGASAIITLEKRLKKIKKVKGIGVVLLEDLATEIVST
jgi:predicted nucleic acid-binding protein